MKQKCPKEKNIKTLVQKPHYKAKKRPSLKTVFVIFYDK